MSTITTKTALRYFTRIGAAARPSCSPTAGIHRAAWREPRGQGGAYQLGAAVDAFYGFNRPGAKISQGIIENWAATINADLLTFI